MDEKQQRFFDLAIELAKACKTLDTPEEVPDEVGILLTQSFVEAYDAMVGEPDPTT
jgi:hypothetical protein